MLWRREKRFESPTASTPPVRIETFGYDRLKRLTNSQVTGRALELTGVTAAVLEEIIGKSAAR